MQRIALREGLFITAQDVAKAHGISIGSAHVLCSRWVRQGILIRLKKNFYVLERNWERYGTEEFFRISNFLQVPSYVSFMTALGFHGVTTQVQRGWYESAALKRTVEMEARGVHFVFHKFNQHHYFGFVRQEGFFIAVPEKAFLDSVHLFTLGRYPMDWDSLDLGVFNRETLLAMMEPFPERVKHKVREACAI